MQLEEAINERADEEMDVSDSDNESDISLRKKPRYDEERANPNNIYSLKVCTLINK
jgi:plasmid maintenance system killer protein